MPRVDLPVGRISRTAVFPLPPIVSDPTNDMDMVNNGATLILVVNAGGSTRNAQAVIMQTTDGQVPPPINYPIPPNAVVVLGPYPVDIYGDHLLFNTDHADLDLRAFSLL